MLELITEDLKQALEKVGIQPGDGLLVHSAIQMLGKPVDGIDIYRKVIQELIGSQGTLVVPTFTLDFPKIKEYDYRSTPSKNMGSFSEYIRQYPGALRSRHAMQSVAVLGKAARDLTERDTPSAFERGSPFERMLQLGFKLLLLGADIQAVSMVHYCETRAAVPYRKWVDFKGRVWQDGAWIEKTYRMYARILEANPSLCLKRIQKELESWGAWQEQSLNYGTIASCTLENFVQVGDDLLARDSWALVENKEDALKLLSHRSVL
ncbi:MAG: AAC(3) family N-acetyltransferase [Anaerolineaceae bacterium]|nr:AAC(3) family N-acetyltransferase [Anaerolineaceae bacterium]MBN2677650.1 AAC(3) family N-acetyltransferase [Anaerolineaceae bacterium]